MQAIKVQTIAWLRADPLLAAYVAGRVYTVVPPEAPFPLITIEAATARVRNHFRRAGRWVTLQVRAQSQARDEEEVDTIADQIVRVLEGATVAPLGAYRSAAWSIDPTSSPPTYNDDLAGVVTRHRPVILRILLSP
jgi:hypothetical protein